MRRWRPRKLQWLRRGVQTTVLALILAVPVLSQYSNYLASRELDKLLERWEGTPQGWALASVDGVVRALPAGEIERAGRLVRDDDKALERLLPIRGNVWSAEIHGVSVTDPLAAAESFAASRRIVDRLVWSLLIPLAATLLLGRVFCSWICPMGLLLEWAAKLRGALAFLELRTFDLRFPRVTKYLVLGLGLALAFVWSAPVLGTLYPPAILGRESRALVTTMFDRAEQGLTGWAWTGLGLSSVLIVAIVLFELVVSERWWCRYVCPGGALYSLLGRWRAVRVQRSDTACTSCGDCVRACPMGLAPMLDRMGMECDSCGVCISHCGDDALHYRLTSGRDARRAEPRATPCGEAGRAPVRCIGAILLLVASLVAPASASAHHILGIPHYAYDESYPQAPVITYKTNAGDYEVRMTGYPGRPVPGERTSLHVYLAPRGDAPAFEGLVTLEVLRDGLLGESDPIYGPVSAERTEGLHKFFPTFDSVDNYLVRIRFETSDAPWVIDLPMVVGEPGSPMATLAGFGAALLALLVVVRAIRVKRRRARAAAQRSGAPT